jgi:lipid A 4'-phosphatase
VTAGRTALVVLVTFVAASLIFWLFPGIDLWAARLLYDPAAFQEHGPHPVLQRLRDVGRFLSQGAIVVLLILLALKLVLPPGRVRVPGRALVFLIASLAIGPGLVVNVGLKDHFGRARPRSIEELGGESSFTPAWVPSDQCERNCSFVSGEVASIAWFSAVAMVLPQPLKGLVMAMTVVLTAAIGAMRMAYGGHFLSDVILAALLVWLIAWACYWYLYRHAGWSGGERIDRALAWPARALRRLLRQIRESGGPSRRSQADAGGCPIDVGRAPVEQLQRHRRHDGDQDRRDQPGEKRLHVKPP